MTYITQVEGECGHVTIRAERAHGTGDRRCAGLGQGMAEALATAGASVVVADLKDDLGELIAKGIEASGGTAS